MKSGLWGQHYQPPRPLSHDVFLTSPCRAPTTLPVIATSRGTGDTRVFTGRSMETLVISGGSQGCHSVAWSSLSELHTGLGQASITPQLHARGIKWG